MRDPERIDGILERLGIVWRQHPSLRLGQLLGNLFSTVRDPQSAGQYYCEDEDLIDALEQAYSDLNKPRKEEYE